MEIFSINCLSISSDSIKLEDIDDHFYVTINKSDKSFLDVELSPETAIELANAILKHYGEK